MNNRTFVNLLRQDWDCFLDWFPVGHMSWDCILHFAPSRTVWDWLCQWCRYLSTASRSPLISALLLPRANGSSNTKAGWPQVCSAHSRDSWNQPWSCHPSQESSELSSGSHTVNKSIMKNHAKWSNGYWGSDDASLELRTFTVSVLYKALLSRDIVLVSKEGSPLRCTADSGAAVRKASRVQRLSRAWGVWMMLPGEVSTSKRTHVGEVFVQFRTYE